MAIREQLLHATLTADHPAPILRSPSPSAAERADSSSKLLEGSAADPAARAPSNDTAVEIWLRAARCNAHPNTAAAQPLELSGTDTGGIQYTISLYKFSNHDWCGCHLFLLLLKISMQMPPTGTG